MRPFKQWGYETLNGGDGLLLSYDNNQYGHGASDGFVGKQSTNIKEMNKTSKTVAKIIRTLWLNFVLEWVGTNIEVWQT